MNARGMKQGEIFAFLAIFFLIAAALAEEGSNDSVDRVEEVLDQIPPAVRMAADDPRFVFPTGTARIERGFREALWTEVFPDLEKKSRRCGPTCDLIEIVGHADEQPGRGRTRSTLDDHLIDAVSDGSHFDALHPGSNADLGMMRAVAILRELQAFRVRRDGALQAHVRGILPFSAAQMVALDQTVPPHATFRRDDARRRIEIFLTSSTVRAVQGAGPTTL